MSFGYELENTIKNLKQSKVWVVHDGIWTASPMTQPDITPGFYRPIELRDSIGIESVSVSLDELVSLPSETNNILMKDFVTFWEKQERMNELGFNHRRGILLYGPPGSGKTSVINLLAKELIEKHNGVVMIGDVHPDLLRGGLKLVRKLEPNRPLIILFEDIDASIDFSKNGQEYLSILDGQDSETNCVVIATTNYIDKLENRIKDRPGRFDRVWEVPNPNFEIRYKFLISKKLDEETASSWAHKTEGWSLAHLKELVVATQALGEDFEDTFDRIDKMKYVKEDNGKGKVGFG